MRNLLSLIFVLLVAACGGGGDSNPSPGAPGGPSTPVIRFEGVYDVGGKATLTVRPSSGASAIGSNALARVDVLVNDQDTLSLAAPNSTDALGRAQYVFDIPAIPSEPDRLCTANLPLRITVADATGFSFAKYVAVCPVASSTFSASSDYGSQDVRVTASSSAPVNASVQRYQETGTYRDDVLRKAKTSLDVVLRASAHDTIAARVGTFAIDPVAAPSIPVGSTMMARVDAGGGAFAEASGVAGSRTPQTVDVSLACCRAAADGSARQVRVIINGTRDVNPASFGYTLRVLDPATGAVVSQESATQTGAALAHFEKVLDVRSGQQVDVAATSQDDPRTGLSVLVLAAGTSGLVLGSAQSNGQARVSVFCCSLYPSP